MSKLQSISLALLINTMPIIAIEHDTQPQQHTVSSLVDLPAELLGIIG